MDFGFGSNTNQGMDKAIILQETKIFNETPLDVKMCCSVLAKVIYMIHVGETLGTLYKFFDILNFESVLVFTYLFIYYSNPRSNRMFFCYYQIISKQ